MKNDTYITVPNLFTTINLFCGFLAVILAISGHFVNAAWLIFIASIFDGLDGKIARASGISSQFGLQMDSLSDLIASGMAPSILLYQVHLYSLGITGIFIAFLPLLFATFRLARYNVLVIKSGRSNKYDGLPAPMGAVTIASVVILYMATQWHFLLRMLIIIVPVVSLLMASTIKYEGLPRLSLREKGANRYKLLTIFITIILLFLIPEFVLPLFMFIYLLSGMVFFVRDQLINHKKEITHDTN